MNAGAANDSAEQWMTPGQVAALFNVNPKTVTRWAQAGRVGYITTVGGHRRYRSSEIRTLLRVVQSLDDAVAGIVEASAATLSDNKRH
ncbi:BldC family transcriptional regulator [Rhodococcus qingshengii]|uniref:BldC family transcriptional regulator n=1 Tax=Rhodococcus qingshengii TaxID=334542 RepID=UPI00364A9F02